PLAADRLVFPPGLAVVDAGLEDRPRLQGFRPGVVAGLDQYRPGALGIPNGPCPQLDPPALEEPGVEPAGLAPGDESGPGLAGPGVLVARAHGHLRDVRLILLLEDLPARRGQFVVLVEHPEAPKLLEDVSDQLGVEVEVAGDPLGRPRPREGHPDDVPLEDV